MPTTRDALIQRVRDLLSDQPFTTNSTTTGTGSTVVVPDGTIWSQGDVGEWQTGTVGYEQFYVTAEPSGNNLTVQRGYGGTTAETHTSGDAIVQNPAYFGRQIQQALDAGIRGLYPWVYRVESITLSVVGDGSDPDWWALAAPSGDDILGLVDAVQVYSVSPHLAAVSYGKDRYAPVMFQLNPPSALLTGTAAIQFPGGLYHNTNDIRVRVKTAVTGTTGDADIEDDGRFPVGDYLITFAAGRLTSASEIARVSSGADLETTGTTQTGARMQTGQTFLVQAKLLLEVLAHRYKSYYDPVPMPPGRGYDQ